MLPPYSITFYLSNVIHLGKGKRFTNRLTHTQFSSVQSLSRVRIFVTPWTAAHQTSLSITNSRSPPKPMSIESVIPSNHLILCRPLLLPPSIFPSIGVFASESALCIRWPKYWSFSFNISPSNEHQGWSPLGWTGWISLQPKGLSRVFKSMNFWHTAPDTKSAAPRNCFLGGRGKGGV